MRIEQILQLMKILFIVATLIQIDFQLYQNKQQSKTQIILQTDELAKRIQMHYWDF